MTNTKNVLLMEGVLISILAGAYRSFAILALCIALILGLTFLKTQFWIMVSTVAYTVIWGLTGFIVGNLFHSLGFELILATLFLALATGINMVFINTHDYTELENLKGKSRDC